LVERTVGIPPVAARKAIRGPKRLLALRSDAHLVDLVRAGDDDAFEVLYERHVAGILGFCRHMLGSQEEAEDAVQQTFVAAHGALRRDGREIVLKPWLYTIARNRCLSMLRARREQPAELVELSTAGLDEQVEQRADLRELVEDVQRLPEQQRAALLLSELDDLSHAEVADVIGCKPQAVKGLVFRARSGLAERQAARAADCEEIRVELAAAKGGGLRRGRLRYHLDSCPSCAAYLEDLRRQRRLLGVGLPVVPALALRDGVMAKLGIGAVSGAGAAAGAVAGGAGTAGSTLLGGTVAKLAVGGAILAGGAGVATEAVREGGDGPPAEAPPAAAPLRSPDVTDRPTDGSSPRDVPAISGPERRGGTRGAERRALGQQRAAERSGGQAKAGDPPGKALARDHGKGGAKAVRGRPPGTQGQGGGRRPSGAGRAPGGAKQAPATPGKGVDRGSARTKEATQPNGSARSRIPTAPPPASTGDRAVPPAAENKAGRPPLPPE
jgi:RNA polymerase sigma factor (sigma-70 family)